MNDYYTSTSWRTPATVEQERWKVLGQFMADVINRLDHIEQQLTRIEQQRMPGRGRRRVVSDTSE